MSLLDARLPTLSGDMVAILGDTFNQVFELARPIKGNYSEYAKVMEHPIETGSSIVDHRVIMPIEIEMSVLTNSIDYRSVFADIRQSFLRGDIFTIQGRSETYENMLLSAIPYEDAVMPYDAVALMLKFKQVDFIQAEYRAASSRRTLRQGTVSNPSDQSTKQRGQVQTTTPDPVVEERGSAAYQLFGFGDR